MPVIHVEMFEGRTREQKAALVRDFTDSFVRHCGGTPDGVQVIIRDVSREDWAVAGALVGNPPPR